jgi:hypothetical protein
VERLELEPSTGLQPTADARPRMDEPPPVRLVAVEDVRLPTPPGLEAELDAFYVGLWQFERDLAEAPAIVYRAENVRLRLEIVTDQKPIERDTLRPQGIEVLSLAEAELKLVEAERDYLRQRGLTPGQESLLLQDPAGNWIELFEVRRVG